MALISTILANEAANTSHIYLYKEGIFLKCYEHSAYLFIDHIKPYQVKTRYIKSRKAWVCFVGFPASSLAHICREYTNCMDDTADGYEFVLPCALDNDRFDLWKQEQVSIAESQTAVTVPEPADTDSAISVNELLSRIRTFDLVNETPMHCIHFIADLQQRLKTLSLFRESSVSR